MKVKLTIALLSLLIFASCTSTPMMEGGGDTILSVKVAARGQLKCELNPVESVQGTADPSGRFFAVETKCKKGKWLQDNVEIVDISKQRSVQLYDPFGPRDQAPAFLRDGSLLHSIWNTREVDRNPDHHANIEFLRWTAPFTEGPETELIFAPEGIGGSYEKWLESPTGKYIAVLWPSAWKTISPGGISFYEVTDDELVPYKAYTNKDLGWLSLPEYFTPRNGFWVSDDIFVFATMQTLAADTSKSEYPDNTDRLTPFNIHDGSLASHADFGLPEDPVWRFSDYGKIEGPGQGVMMGSPVAYLPPDILVLERGVDAPPDAPFDYSAEYELQLRRLGSFEFIGGVKDPGPTERALAGYTFSPDGKTAYMLLRGGKLEIRQTGDWTLIGTVDVKSVGVPYATQVLSGRDGQIILVNAKRWASLELTGTGE